MQKTIFFILGIILSLNISVADNAAISITKEGNLLVIKSIGDIIGLNFDLHDNYEALGTPTDFAAGWIHYENITSTAYSIGMMSISAPAEGTILFKIPIQIPLTELNIYVTANANESTYKINLATGVITLALNPNSSKCIIYPNPVRDNFTLDFGSEDISNLKIQIANLEGKTIYSTPVSKKLMTINLDNSVKQGLYIVTISDASNKTVITKTILKE